MTELPKVSVAMLMAAGLGTRLRPFTQNRCKSVLPVMGVPVAEFAVQSLSAAGVKRIVANVHHDALRTSEVLRGIDTGGASVQISDESSLLLGSAGGLRKALPLLGGGPFFYANADVICDVDWQKLAATHFKLRRQWGVTITLAVFRTSPLPEKYREIHTDSKTGLITALGNLGCEVPYFSGAAVIELEALRNIPEGVADFISLILQPAIQHQQAGFYLADGMWFDVGSPQSWLNTHLKLMKALEQGAFSSTQGQLWRKMLEERNRRIGPEVWVSNTSPARIPITQWQGSCYWDGQGCSSSDAPAVLGPNSVLYGKPPSTNSGSESGIGYAGSWVKTL